MAQGEVMAGSWGWQAMAGGRQWYRVAGNGSGLAVAGSCLQWQEGSRGAGAGLCLSCGVREVGPKPVFRRPGTAGVFHQDALTQAKKKVMFSCEIIL